jgi:CHAT domain-containing protein
MTGFIQRALAAIRSHPAVAQVHEPITASAGISVTIDMKVAMPQQWIADGGSPFGVGSVEPVTFLFSSSFPDRAPTLTLRHDFNRALAHVQPGSIKDGKLHILPFDALKDEKGNYVLESHVVTYAPSATVLDLLRKARSSDPAELNFLGVGGVSYSSKAIAAVDRSPGVADFYGVDPVAFSNLPGSRQEVTSIAGIVPGPSKVLVDATATEANFKLQPLSNYRVVHLAVHGVASPQFPDRAALVLGNSTASGEDGLLQAREIRDLDLHADLVVLSACETGNGKLLGEEGIASLERAFLLAGAKSVIASLWTADDTYTIALMKRLYQHLVGGSDKGTALQQAKLDLLKEFGDQALPIYWAGFTLVGDGSTPVFK